MKKVFTLFIALFLVLSFSQFAKAQGTLARWNFEAVSFNATAATTPSLAAGDFVADSGALTAGSSFTGLHASASTVWSDPAGNGSTNSMSSNNWGVGDYYQFAFSTTGYSGINLQWDQTGSSTGPVDFKVQYSTDGTNFTDATGGTYTIPKNWNNVVVPWGTSTGNDTSKITLDLSSVTDLNNQAVVYIRLVNTSTVSNNGGTVATGGTNRVDNFIVTGSVQATSGPAVGDYGSAGDGNWGTAATWVVCTTAGDWTGATVATGQPNETKNVWIRSGHTVTVDASGKKCLNITVENGGSLVGDAPLPTSNIRYIRIYGTVAQFDGMVGGAAPGTSVALEMYGSFTIQGSGTVNLARIRPGTNISNATLTIDCDMTMMYNGSSGSGGAAIYTGNSGNDNITITLNQGRTLTFVDYAYFGTSSSTSSDGTANTVYNINGTFVQQGVSASTTLRVASGKTCVLNIGVNGSMSVSKNFNAFPGAGTVTITNDGILNLGTGGNGIIDFSDPNVFVGGTGTTTISSGSKLLIGALTGLEPVAGPIRTTTKNLNANCNYDYVGTAAQVTGADLPSSIYKLSVHNKAGVTLSSAVT
ncbi:MAG: hypothetical protein ACYC56_12930, partial [Candidatus Aquicultor sp.]